MKNLGSQLLPGFALLLGFLVFPGCNGESNETDASVDGADASDGSDGGDLDPVGPFHLMFEEGAQVCAGFSDRRSAPQELALRGHLRFQTTSIDLTVDSDTWEADLVQELKVTGPDPVVAVKDGTGQFVHESESALWGWCHHYRYLQAFHAGARPLAVRASFSFCRRNGVSDPDTLTFDADTPGEEPMGLVEDHRVEILGLFDEGEDYMTEQQFYRSCTYPSLELFRITVELPGDDRIVLFKRFMQPMMASGPVALTRAEVTLDGVQRITEDYFHMAYGADMHNFNERYLVVLDPPVGNIHGVHFTESNQVDPPDNVDVLDANLDPTAPLEQRAVESYLDEAL